MDGVTDQRGGTTAGGPASSDRAVASDEAGRVAFLHVAPSAGQPMEALDRVTAIAGIGLQGDRYASGSGHWSPIRRRGDQLTLIEAEEITAIATAYGLDLPPGATRRNITTRGIRLDGLIGRRFRVGDVECLGARRCEPCSYLDGLLGQDVLPVLIHRGGIRAEITRGGLISAGDVVQLILD